MYHGFFINLARNQTRCAALTRHLEEIGASSRYQRFEAVDGRAVAPEYPTNLSPGDLGCWLSHLELLEANRGTSTHLHLVEDDAVFARGAVNLFEGMLAHADSRLPGWDLIFTEVFLPSALEVTLLLLEKMKAYQQGGVVSLTSLNGIHFGGTSSYFVNRHSVGKFADLMAGQWAVGRPIDLYIRTLIERGLLKAYVPVPFLTSVSRHVAESDIARSVTKSLRVCTVYRRAFFKDADLTALHAEMQELIKGAQLTPLAALYADMMRFSVSDQFVSF